MPRKKRKIKEQLLDSFKFSPKKPNVFELNLATSTIYSAVGDRLVRSGKNITGGKASDRISVTGTGSPFEIFYGGNFTLGEGDDIVNFEGVKLGALVYDGSEGFFDFGQGNDRFVHNPPPSLLAPDDGSGFANPTLRFIDDANIWLGDGDDFISSSGLRDSNVLGGPGNDTAEIAPFGGIFLDMEEGDDIIYYFADGDNGSIYEGGPGYDTLVIDKEKEGRKVLDRNIFTDNSTYINFEYGDDNSWYGPIRFTQFEKIMMSDGEILASI